VGIPPSSTGRYEDVQRETWVPSIEGEHVRLKYLFPSQELAPV
jgi:hypothetical protein